MSMLHHISLGVSDIGRSAAFYDAALAPLGYVRVWEYLVPGDPDQAIGYGIAGGGDKLAIKLRPEGQRPARDSIWPWRRRAGRRSMIFIGRRWKMAPPVYARPGPHYYAAFVIDPDGHPIEAVFNSSE